MDRNSLRKIVFLGLLIGVAVVLTRFFSIQTPFFRIGIGALPLVIAGILYGPASGVLAAVVADMLGMFLFPAGPFFPGFTISAALSGWTYGFFLYTKEKSIWRVLVVVGIEKLLISLCLNTYWIYLMTDKGVFLLLPGRVVNSLGMMPVLFLLIWFVAYPICEQLKKERGH